MHDRKQDPGPEDRHRTVTDGALEKTRQAGQGGKRGEGETPGDPRQRAGKGEASRQDDPPGQARRGEKP